MTAYVDTSVLHNFVSRLQMRLSLLQANLSTLTDDRLTTQQFIQSLPKELKAVKEVQEYIYSFDELPNINETTAADMIDKLQALPEVVTWAKLLDIQESYFSCLNRVHEQETTLRRLMSELSQLVAEKMLKKVRSLHRKVNLVKPVQLPPERLFTTPSLDAMYAAINMFWLNHDPNHPPTQKQISYYIAEQLGESDKSRMTDELARAIKPINIS